MGKVILYEHGCPRCKILKTKLEQKGIKYDNVTDVEVMKSMGFTEAPKLEVNGVVLNFKQAIEWLKGQ